MLLEIRIGFWGATSLCFGGGLAFGSKLDVLRKEVEEIFCLLLKECGSLCVSFSASAPVTPLIPFSPFRAPSESDIGMGMGMGIEIGTFSVPFAAGSTPILVCPNPPMFFFLTTGCNPWDFPLPLVRELARELAPPLEELVIATLWIGGLLLVLVAWLLGKSRFPRTPTGIV